MDRRFRNALVQTECVSPVVGDGLEDCWIANDEALRWELCVVAMDAGLRRKIFVVGTQNYPPIWSDLTAALNRGRSHKMGAQRATATARRLQRSLDSRATMQIPSVLQHAHR